MPGQVDQDLWNEHFSRYAFAARLARRKRVLDIACGMGYGAADLARVATHVTGFDVAPDAVRAASQTYPAHNLTYLCGDAQHIPLRDASFDLIVAFEVIEHLSDWQLLLSEARRLLAPGGQFIVSTPNITFYGESRRLSGPNPFHIHEFEYDEFRRELGAHFPAVTVFTQNHVGAILFRPAENGTVSTAEVAVEPAKAEPQQANFFIAVCALGPQTGAPSYAYLPAAANLLRDREQHIFKLESELSTKDQWLEEMRLDRDRMIDAHRQVTEELDQSHEWAKSLDRELERDRAEILRLQDELKKLQNELARCVELLDKAENTVIERTEWAQDLDRQLQSAQATINLAQSSRWLRLGRQLGVGPNLSS